ncbi:DUF6223 family protein, partial [Streptomyces acidiscabies]
MDARTLGVQDGPGAPGRDRGRGQGLTLLRGLDPPSRRIQAVPLRLLTCVPSLRKDPHVRPPPAHRRTRSRTGPARRERRRLRPGRALLLALAGLVVGVWALRSAARAHRAQGPGRAFTAMALGLAGAVVAAVALAGSDADVGTGNGQGGGVVAVVLALIAMAVG